MSEFILTNPSQDGHLPAKLTVIQEDESITLRIDDMFGDNAVIVLDGKNRKKFIKIMQEAQR